VLVEHGFTRATLADGSEYTFTPSLGRVAMIGYPGEIVALYGRLHGPGAVAAAREVLSTFCDQDDLAPLIGEPEPEPLAYTFRLDAPPRWKPGAITEREQVILARHLMQHAVAGRARPGSEAAGGGEYATEFHVGQHVSAAQVHLGLIEADALACSMTKLQELREAKSPDNSRSGPKNVPSRSQYHEAMQRLEKRRAADGPADARRREMVGG
jgi:hypothetical protein